MASMHSGIHYQKMTPQPPPPKQAFLKQKLQQGLKRKQALRLWEKEVERRKLES